MNTTTKLTTAEAIRLLNNINQLAGKPTVVMNGRTPQVVFEPYDFTDKVTWNLARNRGKLREIAALVEEEKKKFQTELTAFNASLNKDADAKENDERKETKAKEVDERFNAFLQQENEIPLLKIPAVGLKLKINKIPHSVIDELMGIIEGEPEFDDTPKGAVPAGG